MWRGWTRAHRATIRPVKAARVRWTWSSAASRNTRPATWVTGPSIHAFMCDFFPKFLEDISPFCGVTDNPVLDFWWHLLWVSKPEWAALLALAKAYMLHVPWDSPLVTPADLLAASMAAELISSTDWVFMCDFELVDFTSQTAAPGFSVQFLSFSCYFRQKICQIIGWRTPLWLANPLWEILDPLLNEGPLAVEFARCSTKLYADINSRNRH